MQAQCRFRLCTRVSDPCPATPPPYAPGQRPLTPSHLAITLHTWPASPSPLRTWPTPYALGQHPPLPYAPGQHAHTYGVGHEPRGEAQPVIGVARCHIPACRPVTRHASCSLRGRRRSLQKALVISSNVLSCVTVEDVLAPSTASMLSSRFCRSTRSP